MSSEFRSDNSNLKGELSSALLAVQVKDDRLPSTPVRIWLHFYIYVIAWILDGLLAFLSE